MITLLRASHANEFELQNYAPLAKEHDIRVITSRHPLTKIDLPTTALWSPTDLPAFPYRRQILNRLIGGEQWLWGLEKTIKQRSIVHTAETYTPYTHQAVELKKRGLISKLICTCWETIPHNNEKFRRLRNWKQASYRHVDLFHTPTKLAKEALLAEGVDNRKIKVIPYGVDLNLFTIRDRKRDALRPLVLTVARLEKEKGMPELESLARACPQADFLVVGQGRYPFSSPNITTKSVPYQDIHCIYQTADIFLFPSRSTPTWEEQYGMALIEAMACGLPLVASDSGAIPEVVGRAGLIFPAGDPHAAIQALSSLLTSPSRRRRYRALSLARARAHYNRQLTAAKLSLLYSSC